MKWTLVYFDDQIQNIEVYKELLEDEFSVIGCHDSRLYQQMMKEHHPHAFLIDVHMPHFDGHELYKLITSHHFYNGCPIFFISGDHSDHTVIKSYESGAVDFLSREMNYEELGLRLSNKIKMYLKMSTVLELGNLRMDLLALKLTIGGEPINLTLLEMRILGILLRAFPTVLKKSDLIQRIWGDEPVKPGTVNTHITNLRPKIEAWDQQIKIREDNIHILPR